MENAMEVIDARSLIDPQKEIQSGTEAANALVGVVRKAGLARKFGGEKEHLFYEAWQTLAKFYGCSIRTGDAQFVKIDEVQGAKAKAEIIDDETGRVVGGAEAYCMRDERNWENKPWYQLASMAQTRAGSKAARNKWAFVPALAGYATTPAEEMDGVENGKKHPQTAKTTAQNATETTISPKPRVEVGGNTWTGYIDRVEVKTGVTGGKQWTIYTIVTKDDRFGTFDEKFSDLAQWSIENEAQVCIIWEQDTRGKKIVSLTEMTTGRDIGEEG